MVCILRCCCEAISSCPVICCEGLSGLAAGGAGALLLSLAARAHNTFTACCPTPPSNSTTGPCVTTLSSSAFCDKTSRDQDFYLWAGGIALAASFVLLSCAAVSCCLRGCIPKEKSPEDIEARQERRPLRKMTKLKPAKK
jgi:hypothetical protein